MTCTFNTYLWYIVQFVQSCFILPRTLITMMKNRPTCGHAANIFLQRDKVSGPYLKPSISRVFCSNPERFSSISRYGTRSRRVPYYLPVLHRTVGTIAVKYVCFCPDLRARRVTQKKALSEDEFEYKPKGDLDDHLIVERASLLFKQSSLLFFFHYQYSPHSLLSTFYYNPFLYFHPFEL